LYMLMSPLRRTGSQLGCSQFPGNGRVFPLLSEIVDSQAPSICSFSSLPRQGKKRLGTGFVRAKMAVR
jgi:hypothetical protein